MKIDTVQRHTFIHCKRRMTRHGWLFVLKETDETYLGELHRRFTTLTDLPRHRRQDFLVEIDHRDRLVRLNEPTSISRV